MTGLMTTGKPISVARASNSAHAQAHGHVADAVAVHGQVGGAGAGNDFKALLFDVEQHFSADGFDLGDDQVGLVLCDGGTQSRFVEHAEDTKFVGHLHGRGARVAVAGHHMATQALGADDEFFAKFTGAEEEDFFHGNKKGRKSTQASLLLSCLTHSLHMNRS
jgi:hypothetical protein